MNNKRNKIRSSELTLDAANNELRADKADSAGGTIFCTVALSFGFCCAVSTAGSKSPNDYFHCQFINHA